MKITKIDITEFGNIRDLHLSFSPHCNFLLLPGEIEARTINQALLTLFYGGRPDVPMSTLPARDEIEGARDLIFRDSSVEYELDSGEKLRVVRAEQKVSLLNALSGEDLTDNYEKDKAGELLFAWRHFGLSKSTFQNTVFITGDHSASLSDLDELTLRIKSIADTGTEEFSSQKAFEALQNSLAEIGSEEDNTRQIGEISEKIGSIERSKRRVNEKREAYYELSSRITGLQQKHDKLQLKKDEIEVSVHREGLTDVLAMRKRKGELQDLARQSGEKLHALKERKESITKKASLGRDIIKNYEHCLGQKDSIFTLLGDYERSLSFEEKAGKDENQDDQFSQKENEIKARIGTYASYFGKFKDFEEFDLFMDEVESKLSQTRAMNEKMMEIKEREEQFLMERKHALAYLGVAAFLTVAVIAFGLLVSAKYQIADFPLMVAALLCIFAYYEFIKYRTMYMRTARRMESTREEVQAFKRSIDDAKERLSSLQKGLGVSTTADIRTKFNEYKEARKDLESLKRVREAFLAPRNNEEKEGTLKDFIHEILEKCNHLPKDTRITIEHLRRFKEEFEKVVQIDLEQEHLRAEYRKVVDELEKEQKVSAQLDHELKGDQPVGEGEKLECISELEELEVIIREYSEEIGNKSRVLSQILDGEKELAEIDEEIDFYTRKRSALTNLRDALKFTIHGLEESRKKYISEVFAPHVLKRAEELLSNLKLSGDLGAVKYVLNGMNSNKRELPGIKPTSSLSFLYIILKTAIAQILTAEDLPLVLGDPFSGGGGVLDSLHLMLSQSRLNQIICVTADKTRWAEIKERLKEMSIATRETGSDNILLLQCL